ncbi:hypothetical protein GGF32_001851 [Allomyces javanicus]|nr:hypothetical protein GGF32_001851 [Allomyces javanicus]
MSPAHQREFYEVKAACYACPFLYMRKDSLAVFLKRTIRPNFQLTIGTNRAFELLGRTETYTHRTTAFVYFTWKRRHLKQHPPADVRTRLKYLVMPAKIAPNMLLELYEHAYGTGNETEVLRVATSLFGEPQAGKYAIPSSIYNERMTWPRYCPPPPGSPPPFPSDAPNGELQIPPGLHSRTSSSGISDTRKRRSTNDGYIAFDDDESSDEGEASDSSDLDDAGARYGGYKRPRLRSPDVASSDPWRSESPYATPRWNARVLPPDEQLPTTASMSIRGLFTLLRDRARAKAGGPSRARTAAKDLTRDPATMPQGRQLTASDFFASFDDDDEDMD